MIFLILGFLALFGGLFVNFGASSSSVPNESLGRAGCAGMIVGLLLIAAGLWEVLI